MPVPPVKRIGLPYSMEVDCPDPWHRTRGPDGTLPCPTCRLEPEPWSINVFDADGRFVGYFETRALAEQWLARKKLSDHEITTRRVERKLRA